MDVLLNVFAEVRKTFPDLVLMQVGGAWQPEQRELIERLGIGEAVHQPGRQPQAVIAEFIRRCKLCLMPSEREGFGLPVAETLACGATLVASDIPVLREVGADAAVFVKLGDVAAWTSAVNDLLAGRRTAPAVERRLAVASQYTWDHHANTILAAYERLAR
jgi:glycosyltransferase involved in cell wall biosynthesis